MPRQLWLTVIALALVVSLSGCATPSASTPRSATGTAASAPTSSPYLGAKYPPLPSGWQDGRAALTATQGEVQYIVQELVQANEQMLWFMKSTGRDEQGQFTWMVTDVLARSDIKEPGSLSWGFCTLNDQPDEELVALGEKKDGFIENVQRAWRANHLTGRFEAIATTGIVCQDEPIGP